MRRVGKGPEGPRTIQQVGLLFNVKCFFVLAYACHIFWSFLPISPYVVLMGVPEGYPGGEGDKGIRYDIALLSTDKHQAN